MRLFRIFNSLVPRVRITPRRAMQICGIIAAIGFPLHQATAQSQVRFGSVGGLTDAGLYLADELGFFAEAGIVLEMKRMASAPTLLTSIATNQLDVAGISTTPGMFTAAAQGMKLRIVGDKQSVRPGFAATRLVVRKELAKDTMAKTVQGLRGKIVAVSAKAGSSFFNTAALLKEQGVDVSEVKVTQLAFPNMVAALTSGAIDAAYIIEPFLSEVISKDIAVDVSNAGDFSATGVSRINVPLVYSEKFAERRDVAQAFMTAYIKGVRVYNDAFVKGIKKEEVIGILASRAGVDPAIVRSSFPAGLDPNQELNLDVINEMQDFFVKQGFMDARVPLKGLVDPSFSEAAIARLGRY
ncbi:MAG: NMT1/THI5-like protein [Hyphomicrobiales bacterium]|nr:NMT1/THI5-like protein [Hyphomicrobiales bacterium]